MCPVCVCVCVCEREREREREREFKLKHPYLTLKIFIMEFPNMYKSRYNSVINLQLLINQLLQMSIYCQFPFTPSSLLSFTTLAAQQNIVKKSWVYIHSFLNIPHVNVTYKDLKIIKGQLLHSINSNYLI